MKTRVYIYKVQISQNKTLQMIMQSGPESFFSASNWFVCASEKKFRGFAQNSDWKRLNVRPLLINCWNNDIRSSRDTFCVYFLWTHSRKCYEFGITFQRYNIIAYARLEYKPSDARHATVSVVLDMRLNKRDVFRYCYFVSIFWYFVRFLSYRLIYVLLGKKFHRVTLLYVYVTK